jgi:hypothetical protein
VLSAASEIKPARFERVPREQQFLRHGWFTLLTSARFAGALAKGGMERRSGQKTKESRHRESAN